MNAKMRTASILILLGLSLSGFANAEVTDANEAGFTTVNERVIAADRDEVWRSAINEVAAWWSSDLTISNDASRLRITAVPQGCFCEDLGDGAGVVHLTVTMVNPGVVIRLSGGLGPLGLMGVNGNMTWEFETVEEGTRVRFTYAVGGYRPGGLEAVSASVDSVIGEALARLQAYIESGDPEKADIR